MEDRLCPALAGSVVRRDAGGWKGATAGVEAESGSDGAPNTLKELDGLPLVGVPNPGARGELGREEELASRLLGNCCRVSVLPLC